MINQQIVIEEDQPPFEQQEMVIDDSSNATPPHYSKRAEELMDQIVLDCTPSPDAAKKTSEEKSFNVSPVKHIPSLTI